MQVTEKAKILNSILIPTFFVIFLWLVKLSEIIFHLDFAIYGIMPLKISGLIGIIAAPLIHGDIAHLSANSVPMWVLMATLLYFYRPIAWKVFLLIYLITGFWVWVWARESYHIGASGVVYGLATFLFLSGIFRKESRLMAISMFIIFTYGSLVWGIFPQLFPHKNISWESHLMGIVAGVVIAVFYKNEGPQRSKFTWEIEDELPEDDENAYWRMPPPPSPIPPPPNQPAPLEINYIYQETEKPDNRDDSKAEKS
jgi:membrane associated rhomboid family serine protease